MWLRELGVAILEKRRLRKGKGGSGREKVALYNCLGGVTEVKQLGMA